MNTHATKTQVLAGQSAQENLASRQGVAKSPSRFTDHRAAAATQRKVQAMADHYSAQRHQPIQQKANRTGLPDTLKSGVEHLSGYAMDDVQVHYNSDKPAQLNAHAYAQGSAIYLGPGQEKHLPHEAWHVVQQKQGRVRPTAQMKSNVSINDDTALEREADVMGARALQMKSADPNAQPHAAAKGDYALSRTPSPDHGPAQLRKIGKFGMEAEVIGERFKMTALNDRPEAEILSDPNVVLEEFSLGSLGNSIDVTLDNELSNVTSITKERSFTVEFISKPVDVLADDLSDLVRVEQAWVRAGEFWKTNLLGARKVIGMVGEAVDWFTQNPYWEAPQFDDYEGKRNIDKGKKHSRLYWDGPGFFTYIDARTPDPQVSMQMTAGSTLLSLDAMRIATSHVLAGNKAPRVDQIKAAQEGRDLLHSDDDPEAWALLKILRDYKEQSFDAWLKQQGHDGKKPKRYQKEYISLMVRNSLSSVLEGMTATGRNTFIAWVKQYGEHTTGPIADELGTNPMNAFFAAPATKEPQANTISIAQLLVSIVHPFLPAEDLDESDPVKPGDAFTQADPALAGFGEIVEERGDQLERFGLDHAREMMRGVNGVIAENRAAKVQPLSKVPEVFQELVTALQRVEQT